uniref:Zinc finger protein 277 n=1 Tax=Cyprinus carpio TaxID=7962 RepID=A0A8C1ICS0_CYPCA
ILREQLQQRRLVSVYQKTAGFQKRRMPQTHHTEIQTNYKNFLDQQQKERDDTMFHRSCMFCIEEFTGNRWPTTVVYCNEFIDTLKWKLENMQCLYCEKTFRDKTTLKDHMRKKRQKLRLRSLLCHQLVGMTMCRFCRCYCCQERFETKEELVQHLVNTGHVMQLPDVSHWDQPQYYVPTYENDALRTALSDSDCEGPNPSSEVPVIAEDISNLRVIKQTSVLNKLLKDRGGSD